MSDTTWKISHAHQRVGEECTCGGFRSALARDHSHHVAEVAEAAVREQIARAIRAERDRHKRMGMEEVAYDAAARIAEGEAGQ